MKHFYIDFEDFQNSKLCNSWVATAIVGAGVVGAATQIYTSGKASEAQMTQAERAAAESRRQNEQTRQDLAPYREMGARAGTELEGRMPFLTSPITMDQETLEKTPGYQFTRTQGLKAVQNSAAARGLGVSGAALKGAASFATGLADQTYTTQFGLENTNRTNAFNRLKSLVDTGETAAAGTGALGAKAADTSAGAAIGAGNAQAAGYNAMGNAVSNAGNNFAGYMMYKGLYGNRLSAPTAPAPVAT